MIVLKIAFVVLVPILILGWVLRRLFAPALHAADGLGDLRHGDRLRPGHHVRRAHVGARLCQTVR